MGVNSLQQQPGGSMAMVLHMGAAGSPGVGNGNCRNGNVLTGVGQV